MLTMVLKARLKINALLVCPQLLRGETGRSIVATIIAAGVPSFHISEKVLCSITEWDRPDGLAAIVELPRFCWQDIHLSEHNALLVLDGLQIPGNVGTIIRCADGAGADGIIITNRRQCLAHPKLLRASMGSLFSFPVIETGVAEAIAWLKRHHFTIVATETTAMLSYRSASYQGRVAVVMGNEHSGISQEWHEAQDMSVFIPMNGRADSLNVGNAAVLMLYEMLFHQDRLKCS
ncbi:MAG: TrmH family RNA methyltransferase [Ktedonobacteraceae bacterium]